MASVSDAQFVEELVGMHAAECRGEALFSRIAANTTDPGIRREMEELVRLEQTMQRHLGRWLGDHGVDVDVAEWSDADLDDWYGTTAKLDGSDFLEEYHPRMVEVCVDLARWEQRAPEVARQVARDFVGHDEVILEYMNLRASGAADPIAPVRRCVLRIAAAASSRRLVRTSAGHVHCRDTAGDGEVHDDVAPLLVMHINQRSSAMYVGLMDHIGPHRRVVAMDHPSYGMSDHVGGSPTMSDYAGWAFELLDALGIERVIAVGEAASAHVAVEMATSAPDRVDGVVLVNCPSWVDPESRAADTDDLRPARPADATGWPVTRTVEWVLQNDPDHAPMHPTQEWMDLINRSQMEAGRDRWQLIDAMNAYELLPRLREVGQRTLLVWGESFLYASHRDTVRAAVPGATSEATVEGGRFDLCFERPAEVASAIVDWL